MFWPCYSLADIYTVPRPNKAVGSIYPHAHITTECDPMWTFGGNYTKIAQATSTSGDTSGAG